MKKIVLIRHGQSTFNAHHELTGKDPGHRDARLTELGRMQAAKAGELLKDEDFDIVIASPLSRALQTAEIIFANRKVPFYVNASHREWLEGISEVGRPPAELQQDFPKMDFAHLDNPWWHHDPRSKAAFTPEPHQDFVSRLQSFRHWLNSHPARSIAVVGHGTFFSNLTGTWLQNCEFVQREKV